MTDLNSRIEAARSEVASLKDQIEKARSGKKDATMGSIAQDTQPQIRGPPAVKARRTLKGHFGKITSMHWSGDSQSLISASQDGKLLLWNAISTNKLKAISLKSNYVMAVGMEQSKGNLVACGGLDNLCTVYNLNQPDNAIEMASHDGFLSSCRFLDENQILTGSGDGTIILWDISKHQPLQTFAEHAQDVMSIAINPTNPSTFVSASVDKSTKIWDIRTPDASVLTISGCHQGDINSVDYMQNGTTFGTGSADGTVRIFDTRACNELSCFGKVMEEGEGLTSVSFSRSGRLIFAGHADSNVVAWDVLSDKASPAFTLNQAHDQHVSCLGVNPNGDALCTGSWDTMLKLWA
mmetsp:Transcript_11334/g.17371  ORF Transcript_11334/g.17371 Transcript_11334/m.17371 type:complete len:351 (-) Transcript_11334:107-1159(-)|eukprot:CAMPEP_0194201256 /NCGR_PEP_ID=MMETSP0156-20130528/1561_1 /TAXON_ID=33649 /ORGANISM="Thalassionema nitzschioides, Strain L26-B" /LENGTH=350 /DNA_ID=CAMNT_0038926389 /DNA_START=87 /DNA_END=1139 /DNA_ORIENTATION=+